jgi:hypothetical protein
MALKNSKWSEDKAWSWSLSITLKENSSGPKTRLGASRFHDPKESPSGQKTTLGASLFDDFKEIPSGPKRKRGASPFRDSKESQECRRQSLERVLCLNLKKVKRSEDKACSKSFA